MCGSGGSDNDGGDCGCGDTGEIMVVIVNENCCWLLVVVVMVVLVQCVFLFNKMNK